MLHVTHLEWVGERATWNRVAVKDLQKGLHHGWIKKEEDNNKRHSDEARQVATDALHDT